MIRVVGLDLSLTSTGIARLSWPDGPDAPPIAYGTAVGRRVDDDATLARRAQRIRQVARAVVDEIGDPLTGTWPDLVVVEGPAYGVNMRGVSERHALRWRVYEALAAHDVEFVEVNPSTLKVYATGDGNAAKDLVVRCTARHYPMFDLPPRKGDGREDVADAVTLAAMGARRIGRPIDDPHPQRDRAMKSPKWPAKG